MKGKNSKLVKFDRDLYNKAFQVSLKASEIEGKKISVKEIIERPIRDDRVIEKLLEGSRERRMGLR